MYQSIELTKRILTWIIYMAQIIRALILKEKRLSGSDMIEVCSYRSCEVKTCLSLYLLGLHH